MLEKFYHKTSCTFVCIIYYLLTSNKKVFSKRHQQVLLPKNKNQRIFWVHQVEFTQWAAGEVENMHRNGLNFHVIEQFLW